MFSTNTIMIGVFPRWSQFWRRMVVSLRMTCHYLNEDRSTTCYNELTCMNTGFSCQSVGALSSIFQVKLNSILLPMFSNDFPSTMEIFSQILCWTSIFSIDLFFISFFEFDSKCWRYSMIGVKFRPIESFSRNLLEENICDDTNQSVRSLLFIFYIKKWLFSLLIFILVWGQSFSIQRKKMITGKIILKSATKLSLNQR